ncbi:glycosyltransferase family 2 protein [Candidatus Galacturonibacter soehngenii]|uniref:Glycosyltransferase family 2 protein n=1 Tax=Candidatus Galacturonatibacter soehngenii TaxID=2307010 RepID=A0A7V7QH49_9FIRM|nr:glycosyltransferase family 2 protein [Candidatus Galacturonibacter soehngenii]KAB1434234.1 glycosyltransferase family 2 protein [Candidatus Galacturonibacter soehngenii]MBA4686172.1 glycosyltransferase family 2 protein [Candidatus Galacturonibacter soehngenii]
MVTISLCMIVKNEEDVIERCLNSVSPFVDEIIVVDTGSTDKTKELVTKFTEKIYDFKWTDDFSAARNFAFDKATMDYILWLDADDIILPKDCDKFLKLKYELNHDVDAVMMYYNIAFDEHGRAIFSYYRERLSKRSKNFKWIEPVHEYLQIKGNIINSDVCITHAKIKHEKTSRNLEIYKQRLARGEQLSLRGTYYYARELKDNQMYEEAIKMFHEFLSSGHGWVEDNIAACAELAKCYQLTNNTKKALEAMLQSFQYDTPRAELCCQIGYHFKAQNQYRLAAYWFETALALERPKDSWGFHQEDYWSYIPCIECCVCFDMLGEYKKAEQYNEKAALYKPNSPAVIYNRNYFESKKENNN